MTDEIFHLLLEQAGPFALGVAVMFLWLRSERKDHEVTKKELTETRQAYDQLQNDRVNEMQQQVRLLEQFQALVKTARKDERTT